MHPDCHCFILYEVCQNSTSLGFNFQYWENLLEGHVSTRAPTSIFSIGEKWASTSIKLLQLCSSHFQIKIISSFQWWKVSIHSFLGKFCTRQNVLTNIFYRAILAYKSINSLFIECLSDQIRGVKRLLMGGRYNPREGGGCSFFSLHHLPFSLWFHLFFRIKKGDGLLARWQKGRGEGVVCTCLDVKSVYFFCFLNNSILQSGMVEHLRLLQNCQQTENHYFQLIHKILKNSSVRFEYTAI